MTVPGAGAGPPAMAEAPEALERALADAAALAVERAQAAGADQAEACAGGGRSFRVEVSGGEIETLKQSAARGLGLRVIVGGRVGFVSTTDFSRAALDDLARRAVALARFSTADPANGLPDPADLEDDAPAGDLGLWDPEIAALSPERRIEMALALERVALGFDPRIGRTDGAQVSSSADAGALVNSRGLSRTSSGTALRLTIVPLAEDGGGKQQIGYRSVTRRRLADMPDPERLAREACARALARIGARSVPSARVPVIMHPDVAASWLAEMHGAFSGEAVLQKSSWLSERLGETIASPLVTLVDDGRMRGGIATDSWDGEGVPTRRNVLIDRGRCAMFLYDTYHARRAGARSTGSAVRAWNSLPGIGYTNLHLAAGAESPEAILARVDRGFYMDDQGSYGFNEVTGDYSFQAQGFWIEKGAKTIPVEGVTVASRSLDMLRGIAAVGNDLVFDGTVASPTILISEMTVSGAE